MDYILLLRILLSTMVLPATFAIDQPLFKSFGLANDEPDNLDVGQRSDEAFTIVGLDTNDAQAAKRLEFLKQQMPNPMRNRLRFGSRLRETKQVEKISANKQLPPAIRRFFKLSQNKQNVDMTSNSTDLPVTVTFTMATDSTSTQNIGPVVIVATDAPTTTTTTTATPATATATASTTVSTAPEITGTTYPSSTTGTTSTTTPTTTTTSTTTTPTTTTSTTTTTPLTSTPQQTTSAVTYPASTTTATPTTTTMMLPDSTAYSSNGNSISDTSSVAMSSVPAAAVKRKIHPFSNRVGSSRKSSVLNAVKLSHSGLLSSMAKPAKNRFVFRVSQASSDSYGSSLASVPIGTSMVPMDMSTTMMSTSSDDGYYDSTDAPSTVAVVTSSVISMDTSMASSTVGSLTSSMSVAFSDDGYYDSTDAPATVAVVTPSAMPMDTSVAPPTIASLTSSMSAVSPDDGYYDATDAPSTVVASTDTTVTADTSVASTASMGSMATSVAYPSSSSNTKSCKPDSGVRTTSQGGVCVSTMDLGTVCEARFHTFEAGQSTNDCEGFDGNWCCYMPASVASSKGRDADGNEE